jgi:hypothetical protein
MYSFRNLACNTPNDSSFPSYLFLILYFLLFHLWYLCSCTTTFLEHVKPTWRLRYNVRSVFTLRTFLDISVALNLRSAGHSGHGLRRRSAAARLLRPQVRISTVALMSVSCEFCVLSCRGLCFELITRPEEYHRMWCVWVWSRNLNKAAVRWSEV